jgi:hypothetical protein
MTSDVLLPALGSVASLLAPDLSRKYSEEAQALVHRNYWKKNIYTPLAEAAGLLRYI